jgi:hypothetical protein
MITLFGWLLLLAGLVLTIIGVSISALPFYFSGIGAFAVGALVVAIGSSHWRPHLVERRLAWRRRQEIGGAA